MSYLEGMGQSRGTPEASSLFSMGNSFRVARRKGAPFGKQPSTSSFEARLI